MLVRAVLSFLFSIALLTNAAMAAQIDQRGGSVFSSKIGPWFINRLTYEDGSRVCWAYNPNYGRREPTFSYMAAVGGKNPVSIMRFDAKKSAKAGETAALQIGKKELQLLHRKDDARNAFHPRTVQDARTITSLLEHLQNSRNKSFYVVDARGKRFKFDARRTTEMITYLETHCGYQRH